MSERPKPYFVEVHIVVRVPVVAKSKEEAERLGLEHVSDELDEGMGLEDCVDFAGAEEASPKDSSIDCLPWGVEDNSRRNWTLRQWLDN